MCDGIFWAVLHTGAALDTCIYVGSCSFAIDNFKDVRWTHIFANSGPSTFIVVDFEGEIPFFIFPSFYGHDVGTPLPESVVVTNHLMERP